MLIDRISLTSLLFRPKRGESGGTRCFYALVKAFFACHFLLSALSQVILHKPRGAF
jgi:hypothetical protein